MAGSPDYLALVRHYEACFAANGDTPRGVDWPDAAGAALRYRIMADVVREPGEVELLDLGCGAGHFLEYLQAHGLQRIAYRGLDLSPAFIGFCQGKFPGVPFTCADILADGAVVAAADYVVMNGVFTERCGLPQEQMFGFTCRMLERAFRIARKGIAFNLMSKHVDWERDDLFHVPYDQLAGFVVGSLSRHHLIRADYGLYEYTVYVYKDRLPAA